MLADMAGAGAEAAAMLVEEEGPAATATPAAVARSPNKDLGSPVKAVKHRVIVRRRLRQKTAWKGTGFGRHGARYLVGSKKKKEKNKAKKKKTNGKNKAKTIKTTNSNSVVMMQIQTKTKLRHAVGIGVLPKARTAFALFVKEYINANPGLYGQYTNKEVFKLLAAQWRELPEDELARLKERSRQEFLEQRKSSILGGIPTRTRWQQGGLKLIEGQEADGTAAADAQDPLSEATLGKAPNPNIVVGRFGDFIVDTECETLGEGSFGVVVKARDATCGRYQALKIFNGARGAASAKVEFKVYEAIKNWQGPTVGLMRDVVFDGLGLESSIAWLAMPIAPGNLASAIKAARVRTNSGLDRKDLLAATNQACAGIKALHMMGYLHLDIKPANMLWDPRARLLQVVDFSLAEPTVGRVPEQLMVTYSLEGVGVGVGMQITLCVGDDVGCVPLGQTSPGSVLEIK